MRSRVLIVDIEKKDWFKNSIEKAKQIISTPFFPSSLAIEQFDEKVHEKSWPQKFLRRNILSSKRFLVTGGCGFIGSHLVDYLSKNGDIITVIDDLSSGKTSNLPNSANLDKLILKDVIDTDFTSLDHFDGVFHLAAQASVPLSINNLYESSSNNLLSSLKIIELCAETSTPLVYASSSAVYGNLDIGDDDNLVDLTLALILQTSGCLKYIVIWRSNYIICGALALFF